MLIATTSIICALAGAWVAFSSITRPVVWSTPTVLAIGLGGGVIVGVIVGLMHRFRRR